MKINTFSLNNTVANVVIVKMLCAICGIICGINCGIKQYWNTGETGINLAGILLLGKDEVINSICPAYKTDAILRKVTIDRKSNNCFVFY